MGAGCSKTNKKPNIAEMIYAFTTRMKGYKAYEGIYKNITFADLKEAIELADSDIESVYYSRHKEHKKGYYLLGGPAFLQAVKANNEHLIDLLMKRNVNIFVTDKNQNNALSFIARNLKTTKDKPSALQKVLIELLLNDASINPNCGIESLSKENSPLEDMIQSGHLENVLLILEHSVLIKPSFERLEKTLFAAPKQNNALINLILTCLVHDEFIRNVVCEAVYEGYNAYAASIIRQGFNSKETLMLAAETANTKIVRSRLLDKQEVDPELALIAFDSAYKLCNPELVKYIWLINPNIKLDFNKQDEDGNRVLISYLKHDHNVTNDKKEAMLAFFIKQGADINTTDQYGKSFTELFCTKFNRTKEEAQKFIEEAKGGALIIAMDKENRQRSVFISHYMDDLSDEKTAASPTPYLSSPRKQVVMIDMK